MDKLVYKQALERSGGYCEICGGNKNISLHHIIFGSGRRTQCERLETVIFLCYHHHQQAPSGVHHNGKLNLRLHKLASKRLRASGLSGEELKKALGGQFYE